MTASAFISNIPKGQPRAVATAPDGLPLRATRYGAIPIQPITGLPANSIRMWEFPANQFVALEVFPFATTDGAGREVVRDVDPATQIVDLHTASGERPFVSFEEVSRLQNEDDVNAVFTALQNPNECEMYPLEVGNTCATCWVRYLNSEAFTKTAKALPAYLRKIVEAIKKKWMNSLTESLSIANMEYQRAMEEIESPRSGRDVFYQYDFINMYHLHNKPPIFRRSNSPTEGLGEEIGRAMAQFLPQVQSATSPDNVKQEAQGLMMEQAFQLLREQGAELEDLRRRIVELKDTDKKTAKQEAVKEEVTDAK